MEKNIEEKVRALAEPIITEAGFSLWDVIFEKEGAMWYLRILFDKDGGIDEQDCADMTTPLNQLMDKQEFIKNVDILEIGSPGLTRRLRKPEHFEQSIDKPVRVMKRGEKGKTEALRGILKDYNKDLNQITIKTDTEAIPLGVKNCLKINLDL